MAEHAYKPSEAVPVSGVYRVEHNGHRETHDATLLQGEVFPACAVCRDQVRFTLKHVRSRYPRRQGFLRPARKPFVTSDVPPPIPPNCATRTSQTVGIYANF